MRTPKKRHLRLVIIALITIIVAAGALGTLATIHEAERPPLPERLVGEDERAVIISASRGAYGFGHIALLLEDEEGWMYASWQSTKAAYARVPEEAMSSLATFNEWVMSEDEDYHYQTPYDSAIIIRGDFSASRERAAQLRQRYLDTTAPENLNQPWSNQEYHTLRYNCVSTTYEILGLGRRGGMPLSDFVEHPSMIATVATRQLEQSLEYEAFFTDE